MLERVFLNFEGKAQQCFPCYATRVGAVVSAPSLSRDANAKWITWLLHRKPLRAQNISSNLLTAREAAIPRGVLSTFFVDNGVHSL